MLSPEERGSRDNRAYHRGRLRGDRRGGRAHRRQASQRRHFGPEYDQLAREVGPRQARAQFAKRQNRVAGLDLKPLSPEQRAAYEARWEAAQEQFIDNPLQATQTAAGLVTAVVAGSATRSTTGTSCWPTCR